MLAFGGRDPYAVPKTPIERIERTFMDSTNPPQRLHAPTVWIVDDSRTDAARAQQSLAGDFETEVFLDGSAALEALAHRRPAPDVILVDWIMPGISGLEVCRFLRAAPEHARVGVLLLTVHRRPQDVVEGLAAGANDFLSKPFETQELRARVRTLVRNVELLERVERAEAAIRDVLANAPDAILAMDPSGRIRYANVEATRLLRRPAESLSGVPITKVLPGIPPEALANAIDHVPAQLRDISWGDLLLSPTVRVLSAGSEFSTAISLRDVTEQRNRELRRLDFYSMVAHDLRSPLSAIQLRAGMLLRGGRGVLATPVMNDVQRIQASAGALITMVNDFLDLARFESQGFRIRQDELDICALARSTLDELEPLIQAKSLAYSFAPCPDPTLVRGDRQRLVQVLSNLIGNAIKFTPAGGRIDVRVRRGERDVDIDVEDTGPGIAPEAVPTLFQRYTRAATAGSSSGSGLGLLIVREIVESHGGAVGVDTKPGRGSRFWIRLPCVLSPTADAPGSTMH